MLYHALFAWSVPLMMLPQLMNVLFGPSLFLLLTPGFAKIATDNSTFPCDLCPGARPLKQHSARLRNEIKGKMDVTVVLERLERLGREAASVLEIGTSLTKDTDSNVLKLEHVDLTSSIEVSFSHGFRRSHSTNKVFLPHRSMQEIARQENRTSLPIAVRLIKTASAHSKCETDVERKDIRTGNGLRLRKKTVVVGSDVVVVSMSDSRPTALVEPVTLVLRHKTTAGWAGVPRCAFWDASSHGWSSRGCRVVLSNITHTCCQCDHLSSFALIMNIAMADSNAQSKGQVISTYFLLPFSILGLALTITTFAYFRNLHSDRTTFHIHTLSCLLVAQLLFVAGIWQTDIKALCNIVAIMMHYVFLCTFSWMLLEGIHVSIMLGRPSSEPAHVRLRPQKWCILYLFAYGVPLLIVAISVAFHFADYGTDRYCWLSHEHGLVWSFVGPALLVIFLNILMLSLAVYVMCVHSKTSEVMRRRSLRQKIVIWTKGVIMLLVFLGIPYITGIFHLGRQSEFFSYIFIYLNATQGVFIFVFHCLLNERVMKEYKRKARPMVMYVNDRLAHSVLGRFSIPGAEGSSSTSTKDSDTLDDLLAGWDPPIRNAASSCDARKKDTIGFWIWSLSKKLFSIFHDPVADKKKDGVLGYVIRSAFEDSLESEYSSSDDEAEEKLPDDAPKLQDSVVPCEKKTLTGEKMPPSSDIKSGEPEGSSKSKWCTSMHLGERGLCTKQQKRLSESTVKPKTSTLSDAKASTENKLLTSPAESAKKDDAKGNRKDNTKHDTKRNTKHHAKRAKKIKVKKRYHKVANVFSIFHRFIQHRTNKKTTEREEPSSDAYETIKSSREAEVKPGKDSSVNTSGTVPFTRHLRFQIFSATDSSGSVDTAGTLVLAEHFSAPVLSETESHSSVDSADRVSLVQLSTLPVFTTTNDDSSVDPARTFSLAVHLSGPVSSMTKIHRPETATTDPVVQQLPVQTPSSTGGRGAVGTTATIPVHFPHPVSSTTKIKRSSETITPVPNAQHLSDQIPLITDGDSSVDIPSRPTKYFLYPVSSTTKLYRPPETATTDPNVQPDEILSATVPTAVHITSRPTVPLDERFSYPVSSLTRMYRSLETGTKVPRVRYLPVKIPSVTTGSGLADTASTASAECVPGGVSSVMEGHGSVETGTTVLHDQHLPVPVSSATGGGNIVDIARTTPLAGDS